MRKILFLYLLLIPACLSAQVDNSPVTGVSDKRPSLYGFRNAKVVVDHMTTLENADILVSDGMIREVGKGLSFPKGTIITDLSGKTVYPSFIDAYAANYGLRIQSRATEANPYAAFMTQAQGRQQGVATPEPRVADYWNDGINASYDVSREFIPESSGAGEYRQAGFGAVITFKADGIARGTSAMVSTGEGRTNNMLIKNRATANYSMGRVRSADLYPASQFGIIALLRQINYDARWYAQLPQGYFHDDGLEAYTRNLALPQVIEVENKLEVLRAGIIGKEFGISYIVKGSGDEYQSVEEIRKTGSRLIIPVNFPDAPDVKDPYDAATVQYSTLKHYELAPSNLSRISAAGLTFAITSSDLRQRSSFLPNLRKAVRNGLSEPAAIKALTLTPAEMAGMAGLLGAVRKGMIANFLITSGNIFADDCIIYENWVQGVPYRLVDLRTIDLRGTWDLNVDTAHYKMILSGALDKPSLRLRSDTIELRGATLAIDKDVVSISFERSGSRFRLTGYVSGKELTGRGQTDSGTWLSWKGKFVSGETGPDQRKRPSPDLPETGKITYPFTAYGRSELPRQEDIIFRNATVWTNEKEGNLLNTDVLVKNGKIAGIGKNLQDPRARVIDATGMHLTPGIIDEHSHIALDATNEMGQAITSEVRAGDVVDPEDLSIYRQLAGGVTAAHILHGSANPIGGQSVIIKHRWGMPAEGLKIEGQTQFLKHALGENVKRNTSRYPNTRMGTEQIIRDAYQRASDYREGWKTWNSLKPAERTGLIPPRKDLELDALVDVLEKRSFIACHTYVQSEGAMMMSIADDFGVKVHALIHFNEAYKIADQIREHGAAASVFSDWWDYKYEVYEGITYNAATLLQQGVLTCLHSDDAEMGRRLNQEAAKIVKYGGISETEALKLVTLNPAKILHLDDRMGSIRKGKDADLVLWTDNPLSVYARASKTMVDGTIYFDEETDSLLKDEMDKDRNRIIARILKESQATTPSNSNFQRR